MDEQQRLGIGAAAFLANEMDLEAVDIGGEMLEPIQLGLVLAPVVLGAPVVEQLAHVGEVGAVLPSGIGHLVGQTRAREPILQVLQNIIGHIDSKGFDSDH